LQLVNLIITEQLINLSAFPCPSWVQPDCPKGHPKKS